MSAQNGICDVCGRKLPPKKGKRGRPREKHRECTKVESRIGELVRLVNQLHFVRPSTAPAVDKRGRPYKKLTGHAKAMRAELFKLSRLIQGDTLKTSTSDRDYFTGRD
jgi:hypothetical protein